MSAAVILQARMGSRRLPGKVLQRIGARTMLDHAVTRLLGSGLPVVVATTRANEDDAICDEARRLGAGVFRGETDDVLGRYVAAAESLGAAVVVRATADNPFVDADGPGRIVRLCGNLGADYVIESGLPVGAAVEAVTLDALRAASAVTGDPFDREHVTTFVRRDPRFRQFRAVPPGHLRRPGLRLTVDTETDLDFARAIFRRLVVTASLPSLEEIIAAADAVLAEAFERDVVMPRGA
jgi:spore coat polysaccharide biosynthesis protein SpsF (cytidylyltransferase family)